MCEVKGELARRTVEGGLLGRSQYNGDSLAILTVIALSKAFKGSRQLGAPQLRSIWGRQISVITLIEHWSMARCLDPKQTTHRPVLMQKVWSGDRANIDLAKKAGLPKILGVSA